ncbi:MAG TPA: hypothetical protein VGM91_03415 [Conexibacter sp.]|jgi:hypothetical protein
MSFASVRRLGARRSHQSHTEASCLIEHKLRPIGQVATDDSWSAPCFRPLHAGEEFTGAVR